MNDRRVFRFLTGLFLVAYSFVTDSPSLQAAEPAKIRLVAYNIKHGRGIDNRVDLKRIASVLRKLKPDLVALQEIDHTCTRSGKVDQAAALGNLLGMHYRFGKFMDFQGGQYGLAVLSRFPVQKSIRHQLSPGAEPRCALEVIVQPAASGPPLSFVSIHNDWTREPFRVAQVNDLIMGLRERKHPVILAGDFNAEPKAESLARLRASGFLILTKEKGAKTFPSPAPRIEIDYFMTRGFSFVNPPLTVVHDERLASDHCPIAIELPLPR
ncbi:MAG: endonuclease/exonuclease/phosphatase family protein [Roseibacillus sp.]|nr:endonuclease/exonuclease/phosphatase family protein [Roseibacillus sp.]